jgi:hypothetical protein
MAVMPERTGRNEGSGAKEAFSSSHADIVERLLEYQRRLREETGGDTPTFGAQRDPPSS